MRKSDEMTKKSCYLIVCDDVSMQCTNVILINNETYAFSTTSYVGCKQKQFLSRIIAYIVKLGFFVHLRTHVKCKKA